MIKIEKNITAFEVADLTATKVELEQEPEQMHENLKRPEMLLGSTYKIKPPMADHALYVTINDVILNPDTEYELRRPFEMFINSKNMDQFQWIVALTRVASAVFRKGGDVTFLVEEFKAVFDPHGGYLKKGRAYMPSLVAEIGHALEKHLIMIGLIKSDNIPAHQQVMLDEKRAKFESLNAVDPISNSDFPEEEKICKKCHTKATILMDGCLTCLNCGDSKCG